MKKKITMMLTTTLAFLFLFSGLVSGEYYNGDYGYDDYGYDDYEYRFDNAVYHLDRYQGPVYYHHHPRADVYFVLVGNVTFVVPAYTFRPYLHRHNYLLVPRTRFISLSCCGLDYYDSYLRFNFYFDFYNRSHWRRGHHHRLRRDFRSYYHGRKHHKWYHKNRRRVMQERNTYRHKNEYRSRGYKNYNRNKHYSNRNYNRNYNYSKSHSKKHYNNRNYNYSKSHSKKYYNNRNYKYSKPSVKRHYNTRNYKYSKSSSKKHYKGASKLKKHIKRRNYKKSNSTRSKRDRIKRKHGKR